MELQGGQDMEAIGDFMGRVFGVEGRHGTKVRIKGRKIRNNGLCLENNYMN